MHKSKTSRPRDEFGCVRAEALRRIATALWDVPAAVQVVIDLGPCRQVQELLIRDLALLRCAPLVRFEKRDWRGVRDHRKAVFRAMEAPT